MQKNKEGKVYARDLDFGSYEETETVTIRGHKFEILKSLPYKVRADISDMWIKYSTGIVSPQAQDRRLVEAMNLVLLKAVKSPILDKKFLESDKCPPELSDIAIKYIMNIWTEVMDSMGESAEKAEELITEDLNDEGIGPELD